MEFIETDQAPAAIGPYSQAVQVGNLLFCSGQIALDPATNQLIDAAANVVKQTAQVLDNLRAVLAARGATLAQVVKTTVYLKDMNDFAAVNEVYAEYFGTHCPARACVEVARLPKDVLVEIDAIATVSDTFQGS